ncbi:MAG: hypothetical protein RL642_1323 [Bacteroidota bacterium]|jgi:uncharacterized membrane protein
MFKINYDALGIAASVACAIHCAVLPLIMSSLPILGINIINNFWFELFMIILALGIGLHSLTHGFKKHHHRVLPIIIFVIGISLLIIKQVLHQYQLWFLIPAVVLIVSAHYINYRQCRIADHCHAEDCKH